MRFIVDTDPGQDDLVAIAVAQALGHISLITTVAGNAPLAETTANALVAADLVGFDGPVVSGAAGPRRMASFQAGVHGETGLAGAPRPPSARRVAGTDAAGAIVEHAEEDTWILGLGPLTNVAAALEQEPALGRRVAGISVMGGGVTSPDRATPVAEFNVATDPEAAGVVLRSGARIVMCGLDVTTQVRYDEAWVASIEPPYVRALLDHYRRHHRYVDAPGAPLHDPCAVLAVTHPEWFSFEAHSTTVSVARTVDAAAVLALVRDVLNGLGAATGGGPGRR